MHSSRFLFTILILTMVGNAVGQEKNLFNGKDLDGWTFHAGKDEKIKEQRKVWIVKDGLLVTTGVASSYLINKTELEDYSLTLEWRYMKVRQGLSVSGTANIYIHASEEEGAFGVPKSVDISLNQLGDVFLRDIDVRKDQNWAFKAPESSDDVEKDMGEWNSLKLICRGKNLTVIVNGVVVNQVNKLNRTKGRIAIRSARGALYAAPTYYRNIKVRPISESDANIESKAGATLAKMREDIAKKNAADKKRRMAENKKEKEKIAKAKMEADALKEEWNNSKVEPTIRFKADVRQLPFPKDAKKLSFDRKFGDVVYSSPSKLKPLADFYKNEMARRGWKVVKADVDDDSVKVTFEHGGAEVKLRLSQSSREVKVRMDCEGLSFKGTDDPAELTKLGIAQPEGYVFLASNLTLPKPLRDLEYDNGDRCLFKCDLELQETFDLFGKQLQAKGFRESRRPLSSNNRRYTEYAKGKVTIGVNVFSHQKGSRAILTYKGKQ